MDDRRIVMLFGARQVGKTTLAKQILDELGGNHLILNGEDPKTAEILASCDLEKMKGVLSGFSFVLVDEAQKIPNIGLSLKIAFDSGIFGNFLVTGLSSLTLAGGTRESLAGRTWTFSLFPFSYMELIDWESRFNAERRREELLVLGQYPALFSLHNRGDKIFHLNELVQAYLYRDVLDLGTIKNPAKLRDLLRLLAYQVGSEVSYHELGNRCGLSTDTVISYIDLLEKAFVLFRMKGFSRNLRKEISKKDKVYFYDNGIRNALIEDLKEWKYRGDQGALWENFLISERMKRNSYTGFYGSSRFWRTYTGAEIDYLEEIDGCIHAFEIKSGSRKSKVPHTFKETYPDSTYKVVNNDNWIDFVTEKSPL